MLCTDESARKGKSPTAQTPSFSLTTLASDLIQSVIAIGFFGTTKALHEKTNVFAVGSRLDTLRNQDAGLILIHVANEKSLVRLHIVIIQK
jgi:hypothetical protein